MQAHLPWRGILHEPQLLALPHTKNTVPYGYRLGVCGGLELGYGNVLGVIVGLETVEVQQHRVYTHDSSGGR